MPSQVLQDYLFGNLLRGALWTCYTSENYEVLFEQDNEGVRSWGGKIISPLPIFL